MGLWVLRVKVSFHILFYYPARRHVREIQHAIISCNRCYHACNIEIVTPLHKKLMGLISIYLKDTLFSLPSNYHTRRESRLQPTYRSIIIFFCILLKAEKYSGSGYCGMVWISIKASHLIASHICAIFQCPSKRFCSEPFVNISNGP